MNNVNIAQIRLNTQNLTASEFTNPVDVIRWMGAMQAQDYAMAKWSLGLRLNNVLEDKIEKAINDGHIIRTHVMRPTWHLVLPEDVRWMLELTAPRVITLLGHYDPKLELTENMLSHCYKIITNALQGGNYLTRGELAEHLERNNIPARGQRLGHIVVHAELERLICSGPRKGKQLTYALLEERVPKAKTITRNEALAKLALKYFTSHGPAQLKDFVWWSGLTTKDAQRGLESIRSKLEKEIIDEKTYWVSSSSKPKKNFTKEAFLLSIFDEYIIAYKDRSALGGERPVEKLLSKGATFTTAMIFDGMIVGTWKRVIKKERVEIILHPARPLEKSEYEAFRRASVSYADFLNITIDGLEIRNE